MIHNRLCELKSFYPSTAMFIHIWRQSKSFTQFFPRLVPTSGGFHVDFPSLEYFSDYSDIAWMRYILFVCIRVSHAECFADAAGLFFAESSRFICSMWGWRGKVFTLTLTQAATFWWGGSQLPAEQKLSCPDTQTEGCTLQTLYI